MNRYDGVKVLLTGAASGIGRATAIRLTTEGAAVYAVDLSAEGLAGTAAAVTGPGTLATRAADVTDEPAVIAAAIAFAGSSDAAYFTGADFRVDGGAHT